MGEWIYFYVDLGKGGKFYQRFQFCPEDTDKVCEWHECGKKAYVLRSYSRNHTRHVYTCEQCWYIYHTRCATYPMYQKRHWYFE